MVDAHERLSDTNVLILLFKFSIKKKRSLLPYIDEALCLSGPQACKPIKLATIGYVTMCFQMGRI